MIPRQCTCASKKVNRVTFDGGSTGTYTIDLCQKCYSQDDKQFMIFMEELN